MSIYHVVSPSGSQLHQPLTTTIFHLAIHLGDGIEQNACSTCGPSSNDRQSEPHFTVSTWRCGWVYKCGVLINVLTSSQLRDAENWLLSPMRNNAQVQESLNFLRPQNLQIPDLPLFSRETLQIQCAPHRNSSRPNRWARRGTWPLRPVFSPLAPW